MSMTLARHDAEVELRVSLHSVKSATIGLLPHYSAPAYGALSVMVENCAISWLGGVTRHESLRRLRSVE
jgi:hypothetical protein